MKLNEEKKDDFLVRISIAILFIQLYLAFNDKELFESEKNCLNDILNLLKELELVYENI